jgi:hypothetical protein
MYTISFQSELNPEFPAEVPNVYGASDYREFRSTLIKIDELLRKGVEHKFISQALDKYVEESQVDQAKFYNSKQAGFHYGKFKYALRCNIARHLTGEPYRAFSIRMADSSLLQWFTSINAFVRRKAISKSSLERYEKYFDEEIIAENIRVWLSNLADPQKAQQAGIHQAIDCKNVFTDSTCVKANIHFPVDWVLFRDAARSILAAIKTIRAQGLKHRMIEPGLLLKEMNKLCIKMTHTRKREDGKKQRKAILREMKKLSNCIARHGQRYRQLLEHEWEKTDWTYVQAQQVMRRIDAILEQLPAAIKQAHDRIIGERKLSAEEKIISLYDKNAQIIVRGKAGSEIEFGQSLLLTEQVNGLIIDWQLFEEQAPSDSKVLEPTLKRIEKHYGTIKSVCADRGFSSKSNDVFIKEKKIYNAICPRNPKQLEEKALELNFLSLQTRRSQTEARIGIFKNVFLGKPLRSRIIAYKKISVAWSVLTHNLWVLSRMEIESEKAMRKEEAAANKTKLKKIASA